jgi:predicted glycogen debranching enzyme
VAVRRILQRGGAMEKELVRRVDLPAEAEARRAALIAREWLVTNGNGGFASGTLAGVPSRRYHGLLVAALPNPLGRTVMLTEIGEWILPETGAPVQLGGEAFGRRAPRLPGVEQLSAFRLEAGLPVWRYVLNGMVLEKRVTMPHLQNTVHVCYRLAESAGAVTLRLRPASAFRALEDPVSTELRLPYTLTAREDRLELAEAGDIPPLRLCVRGGEAVFTVRGERVEERLYPVEESRGYDASGALWTPGDFTARLEPGAEVTLIASTEEWAVIDALSPAAARAAERTRRRRLLEMAPAAARQGSAAELVLAADAFIVSPAYRAADVARARAEGDELRTVIAGYHWFTDWGRDTMIALEGLTLCTGRPQEARSILRAFAAYARDGLIPNMFPEGSSDGLYHTADASLWFFHALDRYLHATADRATLRHVLPTLRSIARHHLEGTRYGIRIDPADGLMTQGEPGYQLTWMDAKVDGWVVTPRRGKAVELNALWYNALRLLARWLEEEGEPDAAADAGAHAERARASFNRRFWYAAGGHLYDVVDGPDGDDAACRPNQLFALSLPHAVLEETRHAAVLEVVRERLLTPVGLRSLDPGHADYHPTYQGDLRTRDGAYHQGTTWGWLIGPYVDAYLRVHPGDGAGARRALDGLVEHLGDFGVGSLAEIFDAEAPFTPRGCIAQAWSVSETLRCLLKAEAAGKRAD